MRRALVALLVLATAVGSAFGAEEHMGIWVPLYVIPRGENEATDEYNNLISSVENDKCLKDSFHGTVLTGPRSGPPNPKDKAEWELYTERFSVVAKTNQWTAFGYVHTDYGKRDLKAVIADIRTWLDGGSAGFGDYVQGIWVDGVRSSMEGGDGYFAKYYSEIAATINGYGKMVAFNPGTNFADCEFLEKNNVAFVNNFENFYDRYKELSASGPCGMSCPCANSKVTRCIASIHSSPEDLSQDDVIGVMKDMASRGYKATFLTDRRMPNHYLQLPVDKLWGEVIDGACSVVMDASTVAVDPAKCAEPAPKMAIETAATVAAAEEPADAKVAPGTGDKNTLQMFDVTDKSGSRKLLARGGV